VRPAFLIGLGIGTKMFSERLECGGSFEAGGSVFWPRLDSFGNLFFGEGIIYLEDGGESFFHLLFACLGLIGKGTRGFSILFFELFRMEREDNYTSGGALIGRPGLTQKEFLIKQRRLKEKKRTYALARAAGHVVPDEVLAGQAERQTRRTARHHKPKLIKNLGELPSHRQSRSRKSLSKPSAIDPNLNNISSKISQLGLMSRGSHSRGSRSRDSRLRGYRSLGSRSLGSRLPEVAEKPFALAPATFGFGKLAPIPEGSMGPNKGGRRSSRHGKKSKKTHRRSKRGSRKN